jgi:hypothetical protein
MRWTTLTAIAVATGFVLASWPADAQTRRRVRQDLESYQVKRPPTRITVRRARSYLDPGTEVLPMSQSYTDYAIPPGHFPSRIWDTTNNFRFPLPDYYYLPGYWP